MSEIKQRSLPGKKQKTKSNNMLSLRDASKPKYKCLYKSSFHLRFIYHCKPAKMEGYFYENNITSRCYI